MAIWLCIQKIPPWALHWGINVKRHKDEKDIRVIMSFQMSKKDQLCISMYLKFKVYPYIPKVHCMLWEK